MRLFKAIAIALSLFLSLLWFGSASAQQVNPYCLVDSGPPLHWAPCSATNPMQITGSFSSTGFPGTTQTTGTPISVTTGGVTGTLPAGAVVVASNVGSTNGAYCKLGASATTSDQLIPPNSWFAFTVGSNTQLTCITSTSTTTVNMVGGAGLPTGSGGGGAGGGTTAANITQAAGTAINAAVAATGALPVDTLASGNLYSAVTAAAPCQSFTTPTTSTPVSTNTVNKAGCDLNGNFYFAPQQLATLANPAPIQGDYFYNVASSVLTRASNTTPYAANETVCLVASVTTCAPITISIGLINQGNGLINRVSLLKSGATTTLANFTIWFFSAAPGVTSPSQFDATAYTGPRAGDMPNYIGNAQCTAPTATSDSSPQVWYDCALSNPNGGGVLDFQALSGVKTIDALISVTAAYTPVSAETFTVYVSGIY